MKMVTAVLQPDTWPDVFSALKVIEVDGLTVTEVQNHDLDESDRNLRVDIVTDDDDAAGIVEAILQNTPAGPDYEAQVWISTLDGFIPVRIDRDF